MLTTSRSTSRFCAPLETYLRTVALLADPDYVRMVAQQFGPRKTVANLYVRLRASEQINSSVWVIFYGKGGIRLRRIKTYYLDQMDHSVRPS